MIGVRDVSKADEVVEWARDLCNDGKNVSL